MSSFVLNYTAMHKTSFRFVAILFLIIFYTTGAWSQGTLSDDTSIHQGDPTIFYNEGIYYLYGTNDQNSDQGIVVYSSDDKMQSWSLKGYALRKGDVFGDHWFWAPQVWKDKGKFYMAYTANEKIAVAESDSPLGPFRQKVKQALASSYPQIDPFIFVDDDGKKYLYHVRLGDGNKVWVAEMTDDFLAMKPETAKECITAASGTWEHVNAAARKVAEGPTVIKFKGKYYLFYSANDFRNKSYAVGYAVSDHVFGPWKRYERNPIIHQSITGYAGSGHGDILNGNDGKLLYVFHTHNRLDKVGPRRTAIIQLDVKKSGGNYTFDAVKNTFEFLKLKK